MNEKIIAVNALLEAGEPGNISVDEYAGYVGYKPQAIIDAMNEVFWGQWGFEEVSNEIAGDDKLVVAQVRVFLKDVDFQPSGWGQSRITKGDLGDARKGAQTDAIKKALSYFSIGNKAYQGLLDNPKKPATQRQQEQQQQRTQPAAPAKPANRDRMNGLYDKGKLAGVWTTKQGMLDHMSQVLEMPINASNVGELTPDLLALVEDAVATPARF